MSVSKAQLETLKHKIIDDFADVPYPKGVIAPHNCEECREVTTVFANKNWKTIEPEILEDNFGVIPLFSPEAFHFFLPAFLIYSLEHFLEKYNTVCEFTIYAVSPNKETIERSNYWQQKYRHFNLEQMNSIYEFLVCIRKHENFESFSEEAKEAEELTRKFIDPIVRKQNL
jgi:hypothetical protein